MVRGTNTKGLVLLLVVFWATVAESAPTLNILDNVVGTIDSEVYPTRNIVHAAKKDVITRPCQSHLIAFQMEFHRPSVSCSSASFQSTSIKSLPPTPRAYVLVLIGFLWITAVKDRKLWITGIATIFCVGQAGFARLPQLATQISNSGLVRQCFSNLFSLPGPVIVGRLPDLFSGELLVSFKPLYLLMLTSGLNSEQGHVYFSSCSVLCENGNTGNAESKPRIIRIDGLVRLCCFDMVYFDCVQKARQFSFLTSDNVNSRLARGPP